MNRPAFRLSAPSLFPLLIFLLVMALTLMISLIVGDEIQRRREAIFNQEVDRVVNSMTLRLENNRNALAAAVGLFAASREVDREEWKKFVEGIEFETRYPGLHALGYIERVPAAALERHEARIRKSGLHGYDVWPNRTVAEYYPVIFIEPQARVDTSYFGFDHGSSPTRLAAIKAAERTWQAVMTETMVTFFSQVDDPLRGLIIYKPFFRAGSLAGFAVGWVEVDNLFENIVSPLDASYIDFQVFDAVDDDSGALVYGFYHPLHLPELAHSSGLVTTRILEFAGKKWSLRFEKALIDDAMARLLLPVSFFMIGIFVAIILAAVTHRLVSSRRRALGRAERLTTRFELSEERFRSIVENLPGAVHRGPNDADYTMEYISDGIREVTGYPAVEFIGNTVRSYASIIHPEDLEKVASAVNEGVAERRPYVINYRILDASGKARWLYEKGQGIFDADGLLKHLDGVIFDVTERLLLEQQLVTAQKMEMMGRMVGGFAHDFNNIMMILRFHAERLIEGALDEAYRVKHVEGLKRAMERADGLSQQLLAFSRRRAVELAPLDLNELVQSTAEMIQPLLPSKCRLQLTLNSEIGLIRADENQMAQVIMNLVVNARDAMPKGGDLTIRTGMAMIPEEVLHAHGRLPAGEYVLLEVADPGQGIDEKTISKIFEPFFTTKAEDKGSGLGLSVVFGVLNQHGAQIVCESQLGVGTTFRIYFPKAE